MLRNIRDAAPDPDLFPDFDENLREAFQRETELFIESQIREDRSVAELLTRRTTRSSTSGWRGTTGFPTCYGTRFRRVTLPDGDSAAACSATAAC